MAAEIGFKSKNGFPNRMLVLLLQSVLVVKTDLRTKTNVSHLSLVNIGKLLLSNYKQGYLNNHKFWVLKSVLIVKIVFSFIIY